MSIRLGKTLKDLNIGLSTAVEFLAKKGQKIESSPNYKLTDDQHMLLLKEFNKDMAAKLEAEQLRQQQQTKEKNTGVVAIEGYEQPQTKEKPKFAIPPLTTVNGEPISDSYTVLKEFRVEFDAKLFNDKVAQVLLKYDFIVGDFADNHLRLKGFYHDRRRDADPSKRAANIERYLKHSCNYMSPHYVLEKTQRVEILETVPPPKKRTRSNSNNNHQNQKNANASNNSNKKRPRRPRQSQKKTAKAPE